MKTPDDGPLAPIPIPTSTVPDVPALDDPDASVSDSSDAPVLDTPAPATVWTSPEGSLLRTALKKHLVAHHAIVEHSIEKLTRTPVEGFNIVSGFHLSDEGSTAWNEIAVLTEKLLLLMNLEELSESAREDMPTDDSEVELTVRVVPLRTVTQVQTQRAYSASGELQAVTGVVFLSTLDMAISKPVSLHVHGISEDDSEEPTSDEIQHVAGVDARYSYDMLNFSATLADDAATTDVQQCSDLLDTLTVLSA